jgi:nitronate monooxygenase
MKNLLSEKLKLKIPLIVAPMAGGPTTPELVIATSNSGALGSIGAAYMTPSAMEDFSNIVRAQTNAAFSINLFIQHPEPKISDKQIQRAIEITKPFRDELGLSEPQLAPPYEENFDSQFEMILKIKPSLFTFIFGVLNSDYIKAAKEENIMLAGTATTLEEALQLQDSGVNVIILQGIEAGGHRGIFDPAAADPLIRTFDLIETCREKINIPLVAAGGIMNSQDIQNALAKGADAVQMGTAFLTCKEAGTSAPYKETLLSSSVRNTKTTRAFSGRLARGIQNRFMLEMDKHPEGILPFQAQNKFTRDIRNASVKKDSSDFLSLWSGTGEGELWTGSASDLIESLFKNSSSQSLT